jgi:tetratricopeptide (TPR) repeat protein
VKKSSLFLAAFLSIAGVQAVHAWSWESPDNALPSLREELDREIATYRNRVANGLAVTERIAVLDHLIQTYQPMGLSVVDLETERSRLKLEESSQALRASQSQDEAAKLVDKAVFDYRAGKFKDALDSVTQAQQLQPNDKTSEELKRKLTALSGITEKQDGTDLASTLLRLAGTRYLENDHRRALNALFYARDKGVSVPEVERMQRLIVTERPELETFAIPGGTTLVDHKLQTTLEAIYDGRYMAAVAECTDVLDLEPENVTALTRLGSSYFAMNERDKAKQIWTKALQLDPKNDVLRKFLYGAGRSARVENR